MQVEERVRLYKSIADEILGVDHAQPEKLVHSKMTFETMNEFLVLWITQFICFILEEWVHSVPYTRY